MAILVYEDAGEYDLRRKVCGSRVEEAREGKGLGVLTKDDQKSWAARMEEGMELEKHMLPS